MTDQVEIDNTIEAEEEVNNKEAPEEIIEPINETETKEEVGEKPKPTKPKAKSKSKAKATKPEPNELLEDDFKNKAERIKHKKVKCDGCDAVLNLKTDRYSHQCRGKLEDREVKPIPRKVAVKPVNNNIVNNEVINNDISIEERIKQYERPIQQQQQYQPPPPEPKPFTLHDYYKQVREDAIRRRREANDAMTANIFTGCHKKGYRRK